MKNSSLCNPEFQPDPSWPVLPEIAGEHDFEADNATRAKALANASPDFDAQSRVNLQDTDILTFRGTAPKLPPTPSSSFDHHGYFDLDKYLSCRYLESVPRNTNDPFEGIESLDDRNL